jgi:hypothetical protein
MPVALREYTLKLTPPSHTVEPKGELTPAQDGRFMVTQGK